MYKVIHFFTDLQDDSHPYNVGDTFPRAGVDVKAERLAELSSKDNLQGTPLIAEVKEAKQAAKRKKAAKPKAEETTEAAEQAE